MREQRHINGKTDIISLRLDLASVNVYGITENLERIEADADRQRNFEKRDGKPCRRIEIGNKEIRIFEISEQSEARHNRENEKQLRQLCSPPYLNQKPEYIAKRNGYRH